MGKKGVTIKAAAEILGVSVATLRNWDASGVFRSRRNKANGYRLYDIGELEYFAEKNNLRRSRNTKVKFVP